MRRVTSNRILFASLLATGVATLGACAGRNAAVNANPRPLVWTPLSCRTCEPARVAVDVRPSVTEAGHPGTYLFARVRNLNSHGVVLVADFRVEMAPESDGRVPGEEWRLALGAAGATNAEVIVLLGRSDVATASINRLERVLSENSATATSSPR